VRYDAAAWVHLQHQQHQQNNNNNNKTNVRSIEVANIQLLEKQQ
jgi:hypothetical protein